VGLVWRSGAHHVLKVVTHADLAQTRQAVSNRWIVSVIR
jgi:hypothetical protein